MVSEGHLQSELRPSRRRQPVVQRNSISAAIRVGLAGEALPIMEGNGNKLGHLVARTGVNHWWSKRRLTSLTQNRVKPVRQGKHLTVSLILEVPFSGCVQQQVRQPDSLEWSNPPPGTTDYKDVIFIPGKDEMHHS